jgi:serine/threonine-protein kinase
LTLFTRLFRLLASGAAHHDWRIGRRLQHRLRAGTRRNGRRLPGPARHLGWKAAIKFLQPEYSERPDALNRFFTEARAASLIDHDGIVRVLDCDVHPSGQAYIVMEYLEGHTLREYIAWRGRLSVPEVASVIGRVADALAAAHIQGIVHRDLKPDNIFVLTRPPGAVKIVDFGVAKLNRSGAPTSTLSGTVIGTPLYMSPEQARGTATLDGRADVYSLGCILFEMLCGRPPFVYGTSGEVIAAHLAQSPPSPESLDASIPSPLRELVERMLAKSPDDRPGLKGEVIPTLRAFATGGQVPQLPLSGPGPTAELPAARAPSPQPPWGVPAQPFAAGTPATPHPPGSGPYAEPRGRSGRWLLLLALAWEGVAVFVWRPWQKLSPPAETATAVPAPPPRCRPAEPKAAPPEPDPSPARAARRRRHGDGAGGHAAGCRARTDGGREESAAPLRRVTTPPRPPGARLVAPRPVRRPRDRAPPEARPGGGRPGGTAQGQIRIALSSDPPGAVVCAAGTPGKLGTTNGNFALRTDNQRATLLVYHPGYHIEKLVIPGDENVTRSVRLRPLTDDDLQPPLPAGRVQFGG